MLKTDSPQQVIADAGTNAPQTSNSTDFTPADAFTDTTFATRMRPIAVAFSSVATLLSPSSASNSMTVEQPQAIQEHQPERQTPLTDDVIIDGLRKEFLREELYGILYEHQKEALRKQLEPRFFDIEISKDRWQWSHTPSHETTRELVNLLDSRQLSRILDPALATPSIISTNAPVEFQHSLRHLSAGLLELLELDTGTGPALQSEISRKQVIDAYKAVKEITTLVEMGASFTVPAGIGLEQKSDINFRKLQQADAELKVLQAMLPPELSNLREFLNTTKEE